MCFIRDIVFDPNLDADFHRGMKNAIDRGAQDDQITDTNRKQEIQVVDRCGDHIMPGVAMGCQSARQVNPMHKASAEKCTQRIGIVRKDNFGHIRLGIADRPGRRKIIRIMAVHNGGLETKSLVRATVLRSR